MVYLKLYAGESCFKNHYKTLQKRDKWSLCQSAYFGLDWLGQSWAVDMSIIPCLQQKTLQVTLINSLIFPIDCKKQRLTSHQHIASVATPLVQSHEMTGILLYYNTVSGTLGESDRERDKYAPNTKEIYWFVVCMCPNITHIRGWKKTNELNFVKSCVSRKLIMYCISNNLMSPS